ncbi:MAG TPA: aspartate/glutamate racemase family protein [Nannocystis sp.]|jgi:glutamate racemase
MKLGVLDWGIGGIDFYARWKARHPEVPVVYWSDSGATPYGKLGRDALAQRVAGVVRALQGRGVTHVVVACNAASTVIGHPALDLGVEVCGVIGPAIAATLADPGRIVGVIGGWRTISSGLYRDGLIAGGRRVISRVAQPLSAMVERGELDSPAVHAELGRILRPLRRVEALVLACTHYPALLGPIRRVLPGVRIVDPAAAALAEVERRWCLSGQGEADMFLTTGDPQATREAARLAFGVTLPPVRRVTL